MHKNPGTKASEPARPAGAGALLCFANRLSVESSTAGIWLRQQYVPVLSISKKIRLLGLKRCDELEEIGRKRQNVDGCMIKASMARKSAGHQPDANEDHSRNLCPDAGDTGITQSIGEISTLSISVPEVRSAEKFSDSCSMIVRRKLLQVYR